MSATALIVCLVVGAASAHQSDAMPVGAGDWATIKYYNHGKKACSKMDCIASGRGLTLPGGYAGFISRPTCGTIGQDWWVQIGGGPVRLYRQADCAMPGDYAEQVKQNLVEVSWEVAEWAKLVGPGHLDGRVWKVKP